MTSASGRSSTLSGLSSAHSSETRRSSKHNVICNLPTEFESAHSTVVHLSVFGQQDNGRTDSLQQKRKNRFVAGSKQQSKQRFRHAACLNRCLLECSTM